MSGTNAGLDARIAELETRLAFQEHALQELSDALAAARGEESSNALLLHRALEELRQIRSALAERPLSAHEADLSAVSCKVAPTRDGLRLSARLTLPPLGAHETVVFESGPDIWVDESHASRQGRDLLAEAVESLPAAQDVRFDPLPDGWLSVSIRTGEADLRPQLAELAKTRQWPLRELRRDAKGFEEMFLRLTTRPVLVQNPRKRKAG